MKPQIITLTWKNGFKSLLVNCAESIKGVQSYDADGNPELVRAEYITPHRDGSGDFIVLRDLWDLSEMTDESRKIILDLIKLIGKEES